MIDLWLARNQNGGLLLFIGSKPRKFKFIWSSIIPSDVYQLKKDLFPEVQWSDDDPTKVKLEIVK